LVVAFQEHLLGVGSSSSWLLNPQMNLSWSQGLELRKKKKGGPSPKSRQSPTSQSGGDTLPSISRGPGSPNAGRLCHSASEPSLRSITAQRIADVVERQTEPTKIQEARLEFSRVSKQYRSHVKAHDDAEHLGVQGVQGFRLYLQKKFGSIVAGWRVMDKDHNGRLSFYEFCNACRDMGYAGNLKRLWADLDVNLNGLVSLVEVDPRVGKTVGKFKIALIQKYGDMLTAWQKGIDMNNNGKIEEKEIAECLERLGLQGEIDSKKLFRMLSFHGGHGLTLQEFDPDAYNRWQSGDLTGIHAERSLEMQDLKDEFGDEIEVPPSLLERHDPEAVLKWRAKLKQESKNDVKAAYLRDNGLRLGLHTVDGFKQALINRCGSLLGAWREALDLDGNSRVTFGEFCLALERLGFHGDVSGLWKQLVVDGVFWKDVMNKENLKRLDDLNESSRRLSALEAKQQAATAEEEEDPEQAYQARKAAQAAQEREKQISRLKAKITLLKQEYTGPANTTEEKHLLAEAKLYYVDLDPETDALLAQLREKFVAAQGNMLLAWLKALDTNGSGMVTLQEFDAALKGVGFSGDPEALFMKMKPDLSRSFLTLQDWDTRAYRALSRGDYRMLTEDPSVAAGAGSPPAKPTEMSFHERQSSGFHFQVKMALSVAEREDYAKRHKLANVPAHLIDTAEEFELLCKRTYGSMIAAWRHCLDLDSNGKLTFGEFCKALRRIGYGGDMSKLWQKYGGPEKMHLALKDLDPEADELVNSFLTMLASQYGTLDDAWKLGFGKDPNETVDEQLLTEACQKLGYGFSPKKLWRCLQPTPGKQQITIWDLDPSCTRKKQRGEEAFIRVPKSPISAPSVPRKAFGQEYLQRQREKAKESNSLPSQKKDAAVAKAGVESLPQLRQVLRAKHGTTVAAWRMAMDPKMCGYISFGNFVLVVQDCNFTGNVKALWKVIACTEVAQRPNAAGGAEQKEDKPAFVASFKDIDPASQKMLDDFREQLLAKFGCLLTAWRDGIDEAGFGRVGWNDFEKACANHGFNAKDLKKVYKALLSRIGQLSLGQEDFSALLIGVREEDREIMWAGEAPVPQPSPVAEEAAGSASPSGTMPPGGSTRQPLVSPRLYKAGAKGDGKGRVQSLLQESHGQDKVISTVDGLKRLLISKYGSLFAAWRTVLDGDHNGIMANIDFTMACRHLGIRAVGRLWMELDPQNTGHVKLKDFDPDADEIISELRTLLLTQSKNLKMAWRMTFDPSQTRRVEKDAFVKGCEELGFKCHPADKAFKLLRPEAGRHHLCFEDLFHNSNRNDNLTREELQAQANIRVKALKDGIAYSAAVEKADAAIKAAARKSGGDDSAGDDNDFGATYEPDYTYGSYDDGSPPTSPYNGTYGDTYGDSYGSNSGLVDQIPSDPSTESLGADNDDGTSGPDVVASPNDGLGGEASSASATDNATAAPSATDSATAASTAAPAKEAPKEDDAAVAEAPAAEETPKEEAAPAEEAPKKEAAPADATATEEAPKEVAAPAEVPIAEEPPKEAVSPAPAAETPKEEAAPAEAPAAEETPKEEAAPAEEAPKEEAAPADAPATEEAPKPCRRRPSRRASADSEHAPPSFLALEAYSP